MRTLAVGASLAAIAGCTTLGPIPATTTVSAVPEQRPDVEVQLAAAPGYYLSSAVVEDPQGVAIAQLSAVFEPARLVPVPGLVVGARLIGPEGDTQLEPIVGVRRALGADRRIALAGLAYGTHGEASRDDASYAATRVGGELAVDVRVLDETRFAELHVAGALSATWLSAEGSYCTDAEGTFGRMCPDPADPAAPRVDARAEGVYPAATLGVALGGFRHRDGPFHGARLAILVAGGWMPRVEGGEQTRGTLYGALGASLSLSFGARE